MSKKETMKKLTVFLILFTLQTLAHGAGRTIKKNQAERLTAYVYGHLGTESKMSHRQEIEQLIHSVLIASDFQKIAIATRAAELLEHDIKEQQEALAHDSINAPIIENTLFIYQAQQGYLRTFAEELWTSLPWYQKIMGYLHAASDKIHALWNNATGNKTDSFVEKTAREIVYYAHFEQEHVLNDYQKTLHLLAQQENYKLPRLLCFWNNHFMTAEILKRAKAMDQPMTVQIEIDAALDASEDVAGTMVGGEGDMTDELSQKLGTQAGKAGEEVGQQGTAQGVSDNAGEVEEFSSPENFEDTFKPEDPEDEPPHKMTKKEWKEERARVREQQAENRAIRAQKESDYLNSDKATTRGKAWVKTKQFFRKLYPRNALEAISDNVTGPIDNAYSGWYEDNLEWVEDNALKRGIESLPGWMRPFVEIGLQMGIMSGGGLVIFWADQAQAKIYMQYAKIQKQMAAINTRIGANYSAQKMKELKLDLRTFKNKAKNIAAAQSTATQLALYEQMYEEQALIDTPIKSEFILPDQVQAKQFVKGSVESILEIDQRFATSAMLTPDNISSSLTSVAPGLGKWRNVFRSGNWQYMADINGFYQTQITPIVGEEPLYQAQNALYNSIFREYIPPFTKSYDIVVECTLIKYAEPFFVGVLFNNARWISGVPDQFHQHRFAGLYGNNKKIYQVIEQSTNSTEKDEPNTLWPVYRILKDPTLYTASKDEVTPGTLPLTFTMTITTSPGSASVKLSPTKATDKKAKLPATLKKEGLATQTYAYNGIGLMSAGCIAQFKITEPKALTYSTAQVDKFKKRISSSV